MLQTRPALKRLSAALCLFSLAFTAFWASGDSRPSPRPHALEKREIGSRLRVFAKPGDFALSNAVVTAVVRKRDGMLTEFWKNRATLPTSEQLDTCADIDGLWQVVPVVRLGDESFPALASRVSALTDGIEVEGVAEVKGARVRTLTQYRLHPSEARLAMTTTFSLESGAAPGPLELGDEVKWGNTTYFVEGIAKPRLKYKGYARWIGRRGAQGDLVLRPTSVERMWVDYAASAKFQGFLGPISAIFHKRGLAPAESVRVSRELAFEPLPVPRPAPPTDPATLVVEVRDEAGRPIAAKVRLDRAGSSDPIFPDDGGLDGADHFLWTGSGRVERKLPAGRYRMLASAGIERDAMTRTLDLVAGKTETVNAALPRVLATPGWLGADLHLHQAPSVDADISLAARVIAVAAEGVELAVATDHYVVTDLEPTRRWLESRGALTSPLRTLSGTEVSTVGKRFGHFNVFPLKTDQNVEYVDTTPSELFRDARKQAPSGVLQVNHPRMGPTLGYFNYFGMDPKTGEVQSPGYDPDFDTIEVYNGDEAYDVKLVRKVLYDFMHLLGRGNRYAATGSSDSHNLAFLDPGLPRTLVHWGSAQTDADDLTAPTSAVIDAIKAGRSIVTSGPLIEASVNGKGPGETARGVGGKARLHVVVRAAPWVDIGSLEVLEGGGGKQVTWQPIKRTTAAIRFDRSFDVPLKEKSFLIVVVQGARELPTASRPGTLPFAFTNPIWVEP